MVFVGASMAVIEAGDAHERGRKAAEAAGTVPPETGDSKKTGEELAALKEAANESGDASEYVETFEKSPRFESLVGILQNDIGVGEVGNKQALFNFEDWPVTDPPARIADFFDSPATRDFFIPRGKGRTAFIEGLRLGPPAVADKSPAANAQRLKFNKSHEALVGIVKKLHDFMELKRKSKLDVDAQLNKPALGETIGNMTGNLLRNYKSSSGQEKLMMLAAAGIGIALINKYKDSALPIFKNHTYSEVMLALGAFWGVNFIAGKMSDDGRTLLQKLDLMRDVDNLKDDNLLKGFCEEHNMGKDQEKLKSFLHLQTRDVKQLFNLYEEASANAVMHQGKKEIDPKKLGFFKNEVNGAKAYEIMEELVQMTAVNEYVERERQASVLSDKPFTMPTYEAAKVNAEKEHLLESGPARAAFRHKYFEGPLALSNQTLFDAIVNEYHTHDWQKAITKGAEGRLPDTAKRKVGEFYYWAKPKVKHYATLAKDKVIWFAGQAWDKGEKYIWNPLWGATVARYRWAKGKVMPPLESALSHHQKTEHFDAVLPGEFDVQVTTPEEPGQKGEATIMGVPGIEWEEGIRKSDGKNTIIIDGIEFDKGLGQKGINAANAGLLSRAMKSKVEVLLKEEKVPDAIRKTAQWDAKNKVWKIPGVAIAANTDIGYPAGTTDITFTINPDGKSIKFSDNKLEFNNYKNIDDIHRNSIIHKRLLDQMAGTNPKLLESLQDLPFKVLAVTNTSGTVTVDAEMAGMKFKAIPNGTNFDVLDSAGVAGSGLANLKMEQGNGGPKFLEAICGNIMESPYFMEPFLVLKAKMENTSEGVMDRLNKTFPTTRLWIIPTSINPKGLNGQILQKQWNYTLDFKTFEALDLFEHSLRGKSADQISAEYKNHIESVHKKLTEISLYIDSLPTDEAKANEFQKLLDSPERIVTQGTPPRATIIPAGIEYLNYVHPDYRKYFEKFQDAIKSDRYNYEGLESSDTALSDSSHEIYVTLLRVWSRHTRQYRTGAGITAAQPYLDHVIAKTVEKLELAKSKSSLGIIKKENLPGNGAWDDAALDEWMK